MGSFSIWHWLIVVVCLPFWLLPAIIAKSRGHRNFASILLVDLFLSWTGIGWVIALVWSLSGNTEGAVQQVAQALTVGSPSFAAAPSIPSLAEEIGRLAGLRDSGALTQAEFERSKARLIG